MGQAITIKLTYDDARWHPEDAIQAAREAALRIADIAVHHPGSKVELISTTDVRRVIQGRRG